MRAQRVIDGKGITSFLREKNKQTDRQTDRQAGRQIGRQTEDKLAFNLAITARFQHISLDRCVANLSQSMLLPFLPLPAQVEPNVSCFVVKKRHTKRVCAIKSTGRVVSLPTKSASIQQ